VPGLGGQSSVLIGGVAVPWTRWEWDANVGAASRLISGPVSAAGCSVHQFPNAQTALYMHEKILLTDNTALIVGSQNLSTTSLLENRELSLALDTATAPDLIAAVESTFDADYAAASAQ
jgi:phosphatidylserine/phosphatidylglycerophosphate/cardiolipin synthase-like enzyme